MVASGLAKTAGQEQEIAAGNGASHWLAWFGDGFGGLCEFLLDAAEVEIERHGDEIVLRPQARNLSDVFAALADTGGFLCRRPSGYVATNARRFVMALQALLDTHICIYIARNRSPSVAERFAQESAGIIRKLTLD